MRANEHQEVNFLIKAFAWYSREPDVIIQFERLYGKPPTRKQLALTNLERYLDDRRTGFRNNHRVKKFKVEREKAKAAMRNVPIADPDWRMHQYQIMYERAERRSMETGNTSRCTDILVLAAKDVAGFYNPKTQNINVDNRTVNVNMTDDEINKRLNRLLQQFGVNIPDMPLIQKGANVIEVDEDN